MIFLIFRNIYIAILVSSSPEHNLIILYISFIIIIFLGIIILNAVPVGTSTNATTTVIIIDDRRPSSVISLPSPRCITV